ncbi:MAG: phosphate acyltransferase PlsX [Bdellovibrionales bacterium]|nr:phosphate acyltransferase PlsX [Bdellovibrionales bacterium]
MVSIAVDAMGGDFAPDVNIKGVLQALEATASLNVALVGDRSTILDILKSHGAGESVRLQVVHAEEVISMEDHAATALRKKKNSSLHVGMRLVKDGFVDAFLSAGNSGAVMACAMMILGRLPGVERPAIVVKLPTAEGYAILLDAGANVDARASHLVQFARMGSVYAELIEGTANPRVALLSNAAETHKGNDLTREADALLRESSLNYRGYVEGNDLFRGVADVVVCDGFVGNVLLKSVEGVADTCFRWFKKELKTDPIALAGVFLLRKLLKRFKDKFDYQPYGAAPLLGINRMVLIGHGSSSELAIRNGVLTAKRGVEEDFISKISTYFNDESGAPETEQTE